jgi:RNA polymerase sigma factor (sigma-70 family)
MLETKWRQTLASIREMVLAGDTAGIDDATLLELFVNARDEAAFEAIVRRHGPLVYGVCLRVLQNASDAEDAFQATFLVLVRKAAGLKRPELLGNWLHGVAFQTARSARATARRHRKLESQLIPRELQSAPANFDDLSVVLDEELERLPAKYRIPIVLCELQDTSRKDAAAVLGVPPGTISSRLARGKALLAQRLTRRNITLGSAAVEASLASTSVAPSAALVQLTVRAGTARPGRKIGRRGHGVGHGHSTKRNGDTHDVREQVEIVRPSDRRRRPFHDRRRGAHRPVAARSRGHRASGFCG